MTDRIDAFSGIALVIAWFALLVTSLSGEAGQALAEGAPSPLMLFGMAGILFYLVAQSTRYTRFVWSHLTFGAVITVIALFGLASPVMALAEAFWRSVFIVVLFSSLGVLRVAAQTSPMVREAGAMLVRQRGHFLDGVDRPQGVGHMIDGHQLGTLAEQRLVGRHIQRAPLVNGNHLDGESPLRRQQLPGHDVGVMLQHRDQYLIARMQLGAPPALRHQVYGLGGPPGKDDLTGIFRIEKRLGTLAGAFERGGRFICQRVQATVNVGVVARVIIAEHINHRLWRLAGGRVIQIDQRLAMNLTLQHRKLPAQAKHIQLISNCEFFYQFHVIDLYKLQSKSLCRKAAKQKSSKEIKN